MLKQWLDAGKCLLGAHQGDWALEAHGSCRMLQVCRVCGQETRRVEHVWAPWSAEPPGCEQTRSCTRCSEPEARVEHDWSGWRFQEDSACEQGRQCTRCATWHDETQIVHDWGAWGYSEPHRGPVRSCGRCSLRLSSFAGELPRDVPDAPEPLREPEAAAHDATHTVETIVRGLIEALKAGDARDALVEQALAALAEIDAGSDPDISLAQLWGQIRVIAVNIAHQVVEAVTVHGAELPNADSIRELAEAYARGERIEPQNFVDAANSIFDSGETDPKVIGGAVLPILGMGLMFNPGESAAFETLRNRLIGATVATGLATPSAAPFAAPEPSPQTQSLRERCRAILAEYTDTLERDGLSEYACQQTVNALKELSVENSEEERILQRSMLDVYDIALRYASGETEQILQILRNGLAQQIEMLGGSGPKLTIGEAIPRGERILEELQTALAGGQPPAVEAARAITAFQTLFMTVDDGGDEEGMKRLGKLMFRVNEILLPYAPENVRHSSEEIGGAMKIITSAFDLSPDDHVGQAVLERQLTEQVGRGLPTMDFWQGSSELEGVPHIRQVGELVPRLLDRMFDPALDRVADEDDGKELKRLRDRFDSSLKLLRHATTGEQFVRPQREGLRRTALEFRQFERRHQLMVIDPVFPTNAVTLDPNRVFFSGADTVGTLVEQAAGTIGMSFPPTHGLANRTHGRWQQLRGSAIAVCDYSAYDPAVADPQGALSLLPAAEQATLAAAGPVATVAYESGWAYVLGKPLIVVARRNRPVPFDIDIEPVLLEDDAHDGERLLAAIQSAFYGIPQGIPGSGLADTIEQVRRRFGSSEDPRTRAIVSELTATGAARARLILETLVDRMEGERPMVVIPTYAGVYPAAAGGHVFHVTPFRDWTAAAQEETRGACRRAGLEYRIGYERIQPDILREVWRDICAASFVVADITSLNPNAALELAIAHAVGRRTLILTQNRQPHAFFPPIEKVRSHHYDPERGRDRLASLLDAFLAGSETPGSPPRHDETK